MMNTQTKLPEIKYNRKERRYEWKDERQNITLTSPPKQKKQLIKDVIKYLYPDLYQIVLKLEKKEPYMSKQWWKGAWLVASGFVAVTDNAGEVKGIVASQFQRNTSYMITVMDDVLCCECLHWEQMAAPISLTGECNCKHIVAYKIASASSA